MSGFETRVRSMAVEYIADLQRRLHAMPLEKLLGAIGRIDSVVGGVVARAVPAARRQAAPRVGSAPKRKLTMTPKVEASRKEQGVYLGLLKNFAGGSVRDAIRKIAQTKGVAAAIADMQRRLGRGAARGGAPAGTEAASAKPPVAESRKPNPFRRIQGQYAGYLRGFAGAERARIKKLAKDKGQAVALAEMKRLAAKR